LKKLHPDEKVISEIRAVLEQQTADFKQRHDSLLADLLNMFAQSMPERNRLADYERDKSKYLIQMQDRIARAFAHKPIDQSETIQDALARYPEGLPMPVEMSWNELQAAALMLGYDLDSIPGRGYFMGLWFPNDWGQRAEITKWLAKQDTE